MRPTFKECKQISERLGYDLIKGNGKGYWLYKPGTRFEKYFPTLMDFVGWTLDQARAFQI